MNLKWLAGFIVIVIGAILVILYVLKKPATAVSTADISLPAANAMGTGAAAVLEDTTASGSSYVINHHCTKLDRIPVQWIEKARTDLHIAYGHTSHGSQITSGLLGLSAFKGSPYIYNMDLPGSLDLRDKPFGNEYPLDLGQPDKKTWAEKTRIYLQNNPDVNVVMWSWCGQLSDAGDRHIKTYLNLMQQLETEFPNVLFVYMTGHLDGSGENGTLAKNNNKIREFCIKNGKFLYDFADIESYNPDGTYYGDKYASDTCDYDSNGDKKPDANWATDWQNTHVEGVDWYSCSSAHSQPVNANMKAYAAWWLFARLAGWDGVTSGQDTAEQTTEGIKAGQQ